MVAFFLKFRDHFFFVVVSLVAGFVLFTQVLVFVFPVVDFLIELVDVVFTVLVLTMSMVVLILPVVTFFFEFVDLLFKMMAFFT